MFEVLNLGKTLEEFLNHFIELGHEWLMSRFTLVSFTAQLRERIGLAEHFTQRMADGFLPDRVPLYVGAFHPSHLPCPEVPLHHRAGPQPLHRDRGKTNTGEGLGANKLKIK